MGTWYVMRSVFAEQQDLSNLENGDLPIWLVYSNMNRSPTFDFNCQNNATHRNLTALIAPYDSGTTVKNLSLPLDEQTLTDSTVSLGLKGSTNPNGCLSSLDMAAYDFRACVPKERWVPPEPMITGFKPRQDAHILSTVNPAETEDVDMEIHFSPAMDCQSITDSISFNSTTESGEIPSIARDSIRCGPCSDATNSTFVGATRSTWSWTVTLTGVANGVPRLTAHNASDTEGRATNSIDHFLFRVGQANNPIVFPQSANYSTTLMSNDKTGKLSLHHSAAAADIFRYSTNFASSFLDWMPYKGGAHEI